MKTEFYVCKKCGKMIRTIKNSACPTFCCDEEMKKLIAGTTDAAKEKHIPVAAVNGNRVDVVVGSVEHPMLAEHYIEWIYLETEKGGMMAALQPGQAPKASFLLSDGDKASAVYAYCNLHSLWMSEIK
ncbi:MAG: desulfoferrodoxin Dfx [Spirochaetales bacterium]|nr:desulfoferrodoxin Dfx [Spirochaetales bacterium]MBR6199402.1 desulfoferrodoxin Dfx [Spirochaetales bacterium]